MFSINTIKEKYTFYMEITLDIDLLRVHNYVQACVRSFADGETIIQFNDISTGFTYSDLYNWPILIADG
jgi:hypothetical protein